VATFPRETYADKPRIEHTNPTFADFERLFPDKTAEN
jgi:hypothetical protein